MRLDNYLVSQKLIESRNKAQSLIKEGYVSVNTTVIKKPAYRLSEEDKVLLCSHDNYVSRAAYKLKAFLEDLELDIEGSCCLDIGASTGGFTQILLEQGAEEVDAVDVGKEQLHMVLKSDARVHSYESCDIRKFQSQKAYALVVSDVSFISLLHILDDVHRLAKEKIILLFKPQFEVGREAKRDTHGVVQDTKAIENAMQRFEDACNQKSWHLVRKAPAKLAGKEGNIEYCYFFTK